MKNIVINRMKNLGKYWANTGRVLVAILFLTLGVGQMWGTDAYVKGYSSWDATAANKMTGTSSPWTFTARWASAGEFKIYIGSTWYGGSITGFSKEEEITTSGGNMTFTSVPADGGIYTITVKLKDTKYYITVDKVVEEGSTAYSISNSPYIYFNVAAASSAYTSASILLGKSDGSQDYAMSGKITNTQLFYKQMPNWSNYKTFLFIAANNWGGSWNSQKVTERIGGVTNTNTYNTSMSGNYHMFTVASGNDNADLTYTNQTTYSALLNKTQTIQVRVSEDNGANYSNAAFASWPGSITVARTYMSSATASSSPSATAMTATTTTGALTSSITFTGANTTEYTFAGWSNSSTGPDGKTSKTYTITDAATKYAFYKRKQYTVSYGVYASSRWGSITLNSGSAVTTTSSSTLNHGSSISFTASPNSGYQVEGWYSDAACAAKDLLQEGGTSYNAGTLTAAQTVYVKFKVRTGGTITLSAGANGEVSADNSAWGSTKTISNITTATDVNIYARGNTGYQFSSWTKSSGSGTIKTNAASGIFTTVAYEDATVTASFSEKMSTITTSNSYDVGNPSYAIPTKSKSSIGIATTATLTATTPSTGYTFAGWTLSSNLVVTSGNAATDLSITVRTNGNGAAATAQANYTEDLTTPYVIKGGEAITGSNWSDDIPFTKKSGESTGTVAYAEIPISAAVGDGADTDYNLKVYNNSNSHWVGLNEGSGDWWYYSNSGEKTLTDNAGNNIQLRANVVGTYIVKLDYTTAASPKITITWPVALSIYRSNPTDGPNIGDHAWNSMPSSTSYRWDIDLEANTTYEFKFNDKGAYYGNTTLINTSFSNRTFATGTVDTKLQTKSAGRFVITYNSSDHKVSIVYPKSATIGASPVSVYTGGTTTLTGYASELGSGSHTITYEFYKGTTLTEGNKIYTTSKTAEATYQQASYDATVNFDGNATSQIYTIQIKEGGSVLATNTVTVYRKWDIYVHDVDSWNAMYYYVYDNASGDKRENWPGQNYSENKYNGTTTWYIVTLDAEYPHFILDNNAGNKQTWGSGVYKNDITDFPAGSFWYVDYKNTTDGKRYYDLHTITPTNPTVTLSASVANCKDITLTGTVTNCGGDGSFASDMKEVYFEVGGTKNAATTVSTTGGTFTKTLTNATAGTTNTLQAFAENVIGTGSSSELHYTNVTLDRQGGTTGATAVTAVEGIAMPAGASVPGKTGYTFGGYYASEGGSGKQYYNASMGSANNWDQTSKDKTIYAKWTAKTYDVILDVNGGSGANQTVTGTYDAAMPTVQKGSSTPIATRSRTGYNFGGYAANIDGSGTLYYTSALASNHIWDVDVDKTHIYAVWTPKQSALTFDYQTSAAGYGSSGSISAVSATYAAAMPTLSGSMPTAANGYAFMGFYDAADGAGTQYYDGTGASVTNWNKDTEDGTTLYAYYKKAEITALTFDAAIVAPGTTMGVTPTISPTPTGTTAICWRVLHGNGNPLDDQPTFSSNPSSGEAKVTFPASTTSGTYLVEAILRKGSTCDGDVLDSVTANFQVAGDHVVTVQYKCGDEFIQTSTTATGRPLSWTEITAPDIFGYTFSKWKAGDGITIDGAVDGEKATATIQFKATYEGKLTAIYTQKQLIYFKNTLGWSSVYVNFYSSEYSWNSTKGSGNQNVTNRNKAMTRIGDTDIWYYDYGYNGGGSSITPSLFVSFTSNSQSNAENFWLANPGVNVVYPTRYMDALTTNKSSEAGFKAATPMFVPLAGQTATVLNNANNGKANYYNRGYWTKYTPGTGYTLEIYNSAGDVLLKSMEFTSNDELMPMDATVDLEANQTYKFQLRRGGESSAGVYYGNSGTMTYQDHGQGTAWEMTNHPSFSMAGITSSAAGSYTFHLTYSASASGAYRLRMAVDYPVTKGDYRLLYKDNVQTKWFKSAIVPKAENESKVSFFVRKGQSAVLKLQKCTNIANDGTMTWTDTVANLFSGGLPSAITKDSVYVFTFNKAANGKLQLASTAVYDGEYYIRTDCANSKWDNYASDPDHRMTYSEYSITHGGYSHYYCHWVQTDDRKNIKFCIANDYSPSISDTLTRETASGEWANINSFIDEHGNILRNANVRFMWNQHDNTIKRAYIDGAQGSGSDNYLKMLSSDSKIKDLDGNIKTEVYFQDNENWIYETNIQAKPTAQYKLTSNWGIGTVITQYFKGSEDDTETLITGSGSTWYVIRVLYDFKTNRLIAAMLPSGEVDEEREINADVMFIREHQGDIEQLILADEGKISKIETAYGVMRFNKWTINNKDKSTHLPLDAPASIYERSLYWVSFPFRVKLSEVFGFGTYGTHWILQYYDGAARAQYGMWAETGTYWKFIWDRKDFILEPNVGYLLTLETELMGEGSDIWGPNSRSSQVELFFPSYGKMPDITQADVVHNLPSHQCEIDRTSEGLPGGNDYRTTYDRRIVDSHWNVLSVPTYVNTDDVTFASSAWTSTRPKFLYTWNADDNTITATSATGFTFHAMHAYMVQFYGNVTWSAHSGSPYPIVARSTYSEAPKEVEFCLELQQNEKMVDRTYISLSDDEDVSEGFAFNEDMTKEFSGNKPAIYTFIAGDVVAAGNTLPMTEQKTIVPIGIETKAAGDYTIAIPAGTEGIGVTLIDEQTGVRTSLSALDYTINLPAGKHDNRFFLEISPIKTTPTGLENQPTSDSSLKGRAQKKVIDGILYIVKDGKLFDARGTLVR